MKQKSEVEITVVRKAKFGLASYLSSYHKNAIKALQREQNRTELYFYNTRADCHIHYKYEITYSKQFMCDAGQEGTISSFNLYP